MTEEETISHIHISKTGNFHDPHVVPPVAPVSVYEQFNCMHVCIFLRRHGVVHPLPTRTVASVLMGVSRERILPTIIVAPAEGTLSGDQKLYNDIIGKSDIVGFQAII